jgi:hypothetical protein
VVQKLPAAAKTAFFTEFARLPSHLLHVLSVTQSFLTRCTRNLQAEPIDAIYVSPIYFNVLGTIVSFVMYNSVVLPIHFPLLLYKKIFLSNPSLQHPSGSSSR